MDEKKRRQVLFQLAQKVLQDNSDQDIEEWMSRDDILKQRIKDALEKEGLLS
jgi:hypothetical protein